MTILACAQLSSSFSSQTTIASREREQRPRLAESGISRLSHCAHTVTGLHRARRRLYVSEREVQRGHKRMRIAFVYVYTGGHAYMPMKTKARARICESRDGAPLKRLR